MSELQDSGDTRRVDEARVNWSDIPTATSQLASQVQMWLRDDQAAHLDLYWCAGRGGPRADQSLVLEEELLFRKLLEELARSRPGTNGRSLSIFFASSAGGVYGDTGDRIANEFTTPKPLDLYGEVKIRLESLLREFVDQLDCTAFVGRISSIYGSHQRLDRPQGLLAHMAFSIANQQPIRLFASLSTARNYIDVGSVARAVVSTTTSHCKDRFRVRNICFPYSPSIGELLTLSRQLSGRRLLVQHERIVATQQSRVSTSFPEETAPLIRTTLAEGFSRLINYERQRSIFPTSN